LTPSPKSPPDNLLARWGFSWPGLRDNRHGEWWLAAQLLLIAAHLLPPWPAPGSWGYAWPLPLAMAGAALVTTGAYGRCRHPLYQAILLCSLGVSLALGSLLHLGLGLALVLVLGGKARREERALLALHPGYADYPAVTPAIMPGLPWLDWRT